ncbi:tRNA pseudouridine(13) synthase TruD [Aurantivibrio infirmus]
MTVPIRFPLNFNFAYGEPGCCADFRSSNADFIVVEDLGFDPLGEGEHVFLQVRKSGQNTHWLASQLASFAKVSSNDVGYAGRKDRHAITTQWFSVYFPKKQLPDWTRFNIEGVELLQVTRHQKKLRPGDHGNNRFSITLRNISDIDEVKERLLRIENGVPNYFGEQRFGRGGSNLQMAESLLVERKAIKQRKQRGLVISAARSYLFNRVLSQRISEHNWELLLPGEVESEPSGPLWGRGRPLVTDAQFDLESDALKKHSIWCEGLEHVGLQQERRILKCLPKDINFACKDRSLELSFTLLPGQYATAVLRELCNLEDKSLVNL